MENPLEVDVKFIVRTFAQKESLLFKDFSDVWRDLSCRLLFWHGFDPIQKFEVMEQLLRFSIQPVLSTESNQYERLGGLYLAYTLHSSQPCQQPQAVIRVTISEYETLNKYHSEIKDKKLIQADYILSTLKVHSAFSICCTPLPMWDGSWSHLLEAVGMKGEIIVVESPQGKPGVSLQMCISRQRQDQIVYASSHLQELQPNLDKVLKDVKVVMGTQLEDYADLKQSLSTYLPQHLLTASSVPQEIDKALKEFTESTQKLDKRPGSDTITETQGDD